MRICECTQTLSPQTLVGPDAELDAGIGGIAPSSGSHGA